LGNFNAMGVRGVRLVLGVEAVLGLGGQSGVLTSGFVTWLGPFASREPAVVGIKVRKVVFETQLTLGETKDWSRLCGRKIIFIAYL